MIEHVYKHSNLSNSFDKLVVATQDKEIAEYVKRFGGNVVMTSSIHKRN